MDEKEHVHFLMNKVVVHSYIYYVYNSSVIDDQEFDRLAKEVAKVIKEKSVLASSHRDYKLFEGFDGSTGYQLVGDDSYWLDRASIVMWAYEQSTKQ